MRKISFIFPLENGLHARPASEFEQRVMAFRARFTFHNLRNQRQVDARSVLALIGADVLYQDACELLIDGEDEQAAHQALEAFIVNELAGCDEALPASASDAHQQPLPVFLAATTSRYLRGNGVSPGLATGIAVPLGAVDFATLAAREPVQDAASQRQALAQALSRVRVEVQEEMRHAQGEAASVLGAHLKLLNDTLLEDALRAPPQAGNALAALGLIVDQLSQPLRESRSQYLQQRALDLQDLGLRLAAHLTARPLFTLPEFTQDAVIISAGLITPGQFLALRGPYLKGIVMGEGGETSHTAILARSFGIPLLCAPDARVPAGAPLLIDSRYGILVIAPDDCAQRWREMEEAKIARIAQRLQPLTQQPGVSRDGERVQVLANIALAAEAESAFAAGAEGIGLFRTEMLFCERSAPPDEEEQYLAYRHVLEQAQGKKVVIRTLDIGGDKPCDYLNLPPEDNPFLGWRAVRLYPAFEAIFTRQMRALLRASAAGPLHIMVPMVATLEEVKWLHARFQHTAAQLQAEGAVVGQWHLGIMAEVPSVLYLLEKAAAYIDFVSIGSNDLVQYFLACDRGNAQVRHLYNYCDPAFLMLLDDLTTRARQAKLDICLCGEMGGDPAAIPLLLGAGLRQISMSAGRIGKAKQRLALLDTTACWHTQQSAFLCDSAAEVDALLKAQAGGSTRSIFDPALVLLDNPATRKADVIKILTDNLEVEQRVRSGAEVEAAIWAREAVFSTALGFAVAIPHCKSAAVLSSSVSLMRLTTPLMWGEDVEVSLVIMLTVSEQEKGDHMKIFSRLARKLMHEAFRQQLLTGSDAAAITARLEQELAG
ncbi:phosphoenolpyruvate--protein phosphotransferase [Superficieibacter sp.]|uniref:phosphoenolpyruvate--protein phosphotransferase n=1 Tax=Superficieibacter sp. TaxID=2303322 RepID=UPI0028B0459E|nr:phosphoenolpyruvate--protein phosphotransferase [Superficieibacter sp.]